MEVKGAHIIGAIILALLAGGLIGVLFGQPIFIHLEEGERASLIRTCDRQIDSLERDATKIAKATSNQINEIVDRLSNRSRELIEINKEINETWQDRFQDLNQTIYDLNCQGL